MAGQTARTGRPAVGDGTLAIRRDHVDVEVHKTLGRNSRHLRASSVRAVAYRAGEAVVDMARVLLEATVGHDAGQVVTLGAQRVIAGRREVRRKIQIGDRLSGDRCLAHIVAALENVRILRSMRTVRPRAPELAVVVAVMAIGAEDANAHGASLPGAIEIEHVRAQAGLRERAAAVVHHRMARR
jgi:hypothetical protein